MIKYIAFICFAGFVFSADTIFKLEIKEGDSIAPVEISLGKDYASKKPNMTLPGVSVEAGKNLVLNGFSLKSNGKKSRIQSKHFVCTSCHNTKKEDFDLANPNPEDRLKYAVDNELPFLQATTFYGAVNRDTYYNGDYDKKYGKLVESARDDIRGAIQLCAVECAQGRKLKDWEIESILAYFWTIDLKFEDLNISSEEINQLSEKEGKDADLLKTITNKYASKSEATFILPPISRKEGTGLVGDANNGELIYRKSCLHCHKDGKYSYLHLDGSKLSKNHLKRNIKKFNNQSIYQVIRWGVASMAGRKSYMPQYTEERLSNQQLADLRAYLES
jgi:mono/diheme cytochrome c family protein